ncbi:acyl-CoA thioesterase [Streptomyces sp. NPDC002994]|uniref:acyl-CoA thioesterase n=1 Tax=Streptomyces sp. NPDC002994 TaxID=3154441 RepID=UPI0033A3D233
MTQPQPAPQPAPQPESKPYTARLTVRSSDLDTNGHVRGPAYLEYADHARWECVRAAGVEFDDLAAAGLGPVNLETVVRFHQELLAGDEVEVSCVFSYGPGKTGRVTQEMHRADGVLAATVESVIGLLDLRTRRLVPDPAGRWREFATDPTPLGA